MALLLCISRHHERSTSTTPSPQLHSVCHCLWGSAWDVDSPPPCACRSRMSLLAMAWITLLPRDPQRRSDLAQTSLFLPLLQPATAATGHASPLDKLMELFSCPSSPHSSSVSDAASTLLALRNALPAVLPSAASSEPIVPVLIINRMKEFASTPVCPSPVPIQLG